MAISNTNINYTTLFDEIFNIENFDYNAFLKDLFKINDSDIRIFLSKILNISQMDYNNLYNDLFLSENANKTEDKKNLLKVLINKSSKYNVISINNEKVDNETIEPNKFDYSKLGIVTGISDNIVNIVGLYDVAFGEMIEILTGIDIAMGMVLNIEENKVSAIIFSSDINIKPGQEAVRTSNECPYW
jgi:F0F1-type ATP synthase alpha subunit